MAAVPAGLELGDATVDWVPWVAGAAVVAPLELGDVPVDWGAWVEGAAVSPPPVLGGAAVDGALWLGTPAVPLPVVPGGATVVWPAGVTGGAVPSTVDWTVLTNDSTLETVCFSVCIAGGGGPALGVDAGATVGGEDTAALGVACWVGVTLT